MQITHDKHWFDVKGIIAIYLVTCENADFSPGSRGGGETSADLLSGHTFNDRGLWPPPARHKLPAIAAPISIYTPPPLSLSLSLSDTQTPPPTKPIKSLPKKRHLSISLCCPYPGSSKAKKTLPIYSPPPPPFSLTPERPARVPIGQLPTLLYGTGSRPRRQGGV